jgi:hypothetical protein
MVGAGAVSALDSPDPIDPDKKPIPQKTPAAAHRISCALHCHGIPRLRESVRDALCFVNTTAQAASALAAHGE